MSASTPRLVSLLILAGCGTNPDAAIGSAHPDVGETSLRGLAPWSSTVCWASGQHGTVLRTLDGGRTWEHHTVPGAEQLDLRDIEAFGPDEAVAMGITEPAALFRTTDGGATWDEVYRHPAADAFFDTLAFRGDHGYLFGDPVDGQFLWLESSDRGRTWIDRRGALPAPRSGEGGFAASGSMVAVADDGVAIVTSRYARVFRQTGEWHVTEAPLRRGEDENGGFSIWIDDEKGIVVGGRYNAPDERDGCAAFSDDGGRTWRASVVQPSGYRSAVTVSPSGHIAVAAGPNGIDVSRDGGRTWERWLDVGFHAIAFARDGSLWAAGSGGRVARVGPPD